MTDKKAFAVRDLLLAVLHAVDMSSVPVDMLVKVGTYMGVPENEIWDSLGELVNSDYIEEDETSNYRILPSRSLFSQHFDQWRLGEKRRVDWDGSWIVCDLPEDYPDKAARQKSLWALNLLGFETTSEKLVIRPNNLLGGIDALNLKLAIFGMERSAELKLVNDYPQEFQEFLETSLWPVKDLTENYHEAYQKVEAGYAMLKSRVTQSVLVYALKVGYEAITMLAIDPLLPEKMHDPEPRIKLTNILIDYENLGKRYWEKVIPGLSFN